jgi:holliday junction DNA helicase RuvA
VIAYLEGTVRFREPDRIVLLTAGIGFEVLIPPIVMDSLTDRDPEESVSLHIYHHQTERQPRPVLIGFRTATEKAFFQQLISVEDIGPLKAVRALTLPIGEIAGAIEAGDARTLGRLKGIGPRTAQKMIATLGGKLGDLRNEGEAPAPPHRVAPYGGQAGRLGDPAEAVIEVLVEKLGHKPADARRRVAEALERNPAIASPEALFDEVYRGDGST